MKCLFHFGISSMKEGTSAQLSGRGELHGAASMTTLVTLRKCTLGFKREPTISQSIKKFYRPSALVSNPVSLTGTSGIKTTSTSSKRTVLSYLRPHLVSAYSGPISAQVTLALIAQWTRECFYSSLTLTELRSRMQTIVDAFGCHASKQSDSRDGGLIFNLPIPCCTNSLLYVHFIHGLPRFGSYDSCLVVTCGLSRFTRVFPCNKKITGEQVVKMLVEQWLEPYGAPKQVHSDEGVRTCSDTGWVGGLRFDFAGIRRLSAPGGHLVGPGDILPTGS